MRANTGRDATRRSRTIGTARQGRGQNNSLVIATRSHPELRLFYESLGTYNTVARDIGGSQITFLVEATRAQCRHACTIDDITRMLQLVPREDLVGLAMIVLRQPRRKEKFLSPVWGRWHPSVQIGRHEGSAIFLESLELNRPLRWSRSLDPAGEHELQRLREDGHGVHSTARHYEIWPSLQSVRATQLIRTLPHEIGHHIDYRRNPNAFWHKARADKEAFAHRYADALCQKGQQQGALPFERLCCAQSLARDGLHTEDFLLEA